MTCNNIIINGVNPVFPLSTSAWKEFSVMENLTIPVQKLDMKRITSLNISAEIVDFEVVRTPVTNKNFEGIISTGYKLIVKGKLIQFIEYIADKCDGSAHSAHFEVPFCTYIVLPDYYVPGNSITVNSIVEDVFVEQTSKRCFFKNVTMFVYADVCCGVAGDGLATPKVEAADKTVVIEDTGVNVFDVYVCENNLPQVINILSDPFAEIELTTALPVGYSYNAGILTIANGAEGGTFEFEIIQTPCNVPFTVNVIVNSPPKVSMISQTPSNLKVTKLTDDDILIKFEPNTKVDGVASFIVEPYTVLSLASALPAGYSYSNNTLTIKNSAQDAGLTFVSKNSECDIVVNLKVDVNTIIKEEEEVKTAEKEQVEEVSKV